MSNLHARCGSACLLGAPRPFALGGTTRVYERARPFQIRHLSLEIGFDFAGRSIDAVATLDVERVDASATEVCLDAVAFEIASVSLIDAKTRAAIFVYDGQTLRVAIGGAERRTRIRIAYRATPRRG